MRKFSAFSGFFGASNLDQEPFLEQNQADIDQNIQVNNATDSPLNEDSSNLFGKGEALNFGDNESNKPNNFGNIFSNNNSNNSGNNSNNNLNQKSFFDHATSLNNTQNSQSNLMNNQQNNKNINKENSQNDKNKKTDTPKDSKNLQDIDIQEQNEWDNNLEKIRKQQYMQNYIKKMREHDNLASKVKSRNNNQ